MSGCALDIDQCITAYDLDNTPLTYCGGEGLDPDWATNPPDLTKSGEVATCIMDWANAEQQNVDFYPVKREAFKKVLRYLVECALDSSQSVTVYDENDQALDFQGALGLAPGWREGPLPPRGQRLVSACLAARSNANGQPVHVSLRGGNIQTTANERDLFDHHEGGFWADLFVPEPYINTCAVKGGGLSGRICTESGECGFTERGDCSSLCNNYDPSNGTYSDCEGDNTVINTYLNLGQHIEYGARHSCHRASDGTVLCWGRNRSGELGIGSYSRKELEPVEVTELGDGVAEVVSGRAHTCARKREGTLWCWGKNSHGQLGDGTKHKSALPIRIDALGADVATIGMGKNHGCAQKTDGTLWCWGDNSHGQLGDGTNKTRLQPVQVAALESSVAEVSSGTNARTTCAVDNTGHAWCWGKNSRGQLGDGSRSHRRSPVAVATDHDGNQFDQVTDICVGKAHTCARKSDGSVWCWGDDSRGQLGDGPRRVSKTRPVKVALNGDAALHGLSCGFKHTCAITTTGRLQCWGRNRTGELGDGTFISRSVPVEVNTLGPTVKRVTVADRHSCATQNDGTQWCWGRDKLDVLFPGRVSNVPVKLDFFSEE